MITNLKIQNFRKFKDKELSFQKGINVIQGNNEAGKSTIMTAILAALYTDVNTRAKSFFEQAASWNADSKEIFLELEFLKEDSSYKLTRDFAKKEQLFSSLSHGLKLDDHPSILAATQKHLGIPTQEVLEAGAFIRQSELTSLKLTADVRKQLQMVSSLSPEAVNLEENMKQLDKELREMRLGLHRPSKKIGVLKELADKKQELSQRLKQAEEAQSKLLSARGSEENAGGKLKETNTKIAAIEKELENHKKYEAGGKELKQLEDSINEITAVLNSISDLSRQAKLIEQDLEQSQKLANDSLVEDSEKITGLRQLIAARKEEIADVKTNTADVKLPETKLNYLEVEQRRDKGQIATALGYLLALLGVGALLLGLVNVGSTQAGILIAAGVVALIVAAVLVVTGLAASNKRKEKYETVLRQDESLRLLGQQVAVLTEKIKGYQQDIDGVLVKYGYPTVEEFFAAKARRVTLQEESGRIKATIKGNLGGRNPDDIEKSRTEKLSRKAELESNVLTEEVKACNFTPSDYLRKRRELDMLLIERKRLERQEAEGAVRQDVAKETGAIGAPGEVKEELELVTEREQQAQEREQVLEMSLELLGEVIKTSSRSASQAVSTEVEKYLPRITNKRYADVRLTDAFDLEVFSSEANAWIKPLGQLSLGTVDQIYFVARLALASNLLGDRFNYLFLDDPFVTFDAERLAQVREVLTEVSEKAQVFLFTHSDTYRDWGQTVEVS